MKKKLDKLNNFLFFNILLLILFVIFFSSYKILVKYYPLNIFYIIILFAFLFDLIFWIFSFLNKKKKEFVLSNISLYFFLFIFNYLFSSVHDNEREASYLEKYEKLYLKSGIYLNFRPKAIRDKNNYNIYPLGSIPEKKMFFCNEDLKKDLFISNDEYGFNNPAGIKYFNSDIMLIGDSFTQGECVENKNNISNNLKNYYSDREILNFGMGGSGPISHLAIIREYAASFKPKNILIFIVGNNDRWDLNSEYQNKILKNYVNYKNYTQGLINKKHLITNLIDDEFNQTFKNFEMINNNFFIKLKNFFTLQKTRAYITSRIHILLNESLSRYNFELDKHVIDLIYEEKNKINSNLFIIYLPDYYELFSEDKNYVLLRNQYIQILNEKKIKYINFYPLFKDLIRQKNYTKKDFFVLGFSENHYTAEIYKFIADTIIKKNILKF